MYTLEQANQLVSEAYRLWSHLNSSFLSVAIPTYRSGSVNGTTETSRLHRISEKAHKRLQRRKDIRDDIKWPRRIEIRQKQEAEALRKAARRTKSVK